MIGQALAPQKNGLIFCPSGQSLFLTYDSLTHRETASDVPLPQVRI